MIVLLTSVEPALEPYRQQLEASLQAHGDGAFGVRRAPLTTLPEQREAALRDVDVVVCLVSDSNEPELPDGSGYAETEVATARRLGIRVLAYATDADTAQLPDHPLQRYGVARARRFCSWLREHYGVRRFTTADELIRNVTDTLAERSSPARPVAPRMHDAPAAHQAASLDACAISLHNMDLIYRVREITPLREEHVDPPKRVPGGGGANTIYALARLGAATAVAGAVAADADGAALRVSLAAAGVRTDLLLELTDSSIRTGRALIFVDANKRRSIFTEAGANACFASELDRRGARDALVATLAQARVAVLTAFDTEPERRMQEQMLDLLPTETLVAYTPGSLFRNPTRSALEPLLERANVLFISDVALPRLLAGIVAHIHDQKMTTVQQVHRLIQWRHDLGAHSPLMVVVRRPWRSYDARHALTHIDVAWGHEGLEGQVTSTGRPSHDAVDTLVDGTGTGGALAAGVLHALLRSRPPQDCANLAYVMAMSAATTYGSRDGVPSRGTIADRWRYWLDDEAPSWV